MSQPEVPQVVVVGAGISGLACARALQDAGRSVRVIEKGRGVGGRLATRRIGAARIDHGAQFFTVRSAEFQQTVDAAVGDGAVRVWTRGFEAEPDGYPRYCGTDGMTSLAKWMAEGLQIEVGRTVVDLADLPAPAYVLTAPVPQSLAILSFSKMLPEPVQAIELAALAYKPTIAILLELEADPSGLAPHGGLQLVDHPHLAFVSDNRAKGISGAPALTIHLSNEYSAELWDTPDAAVLAAALGHVAGFVSVPAVTNSQVQRWRYAGPVQVHPEPTVAWGDHPIVALAGEAFAGPKVEGAFRSGLAAAFEVDRRLG